MPSIQAKITNSPCTAYREGPMKSIIKKDFLVKILLVIIFILVTPYLFSYFDIILKGPGGVRLRHIQGGTFSTDTLSTAV